MSKKTNPRNIPRSQADCDKAFDHGVREGVSGSTAIFLTVMVDKFGEADNVPNIWREIIKLSEEVSEKRVSMPDLKRVLKEEYDICV